MIKKTVVMLAVALCSSVPAAYATTNLVANGSFEQNVYVGDIKQLKQSNSLLGWTLSGQVDLVNDNYWEAFDGFTSLDLDGQRVGTIWQDLSTTSGQEYLLTFAISGNPDYCVGCDKNMTLTIDIDNELYSFTIDSSQSHLDMNWETKSINFVADDTTTLLKFASNTPGAYGMVLDGVSVVAVPESETWAMMLVGVGLVGLRLRKKYHKENLLLS